MIHLPRVLAAAGEVQHFCRQQSWHFCFIGGVAVQRWGEPRLTQYVDLTLLARFGSEEAFVDLRLKAFVPRRADARAFALSRRVLLIQTRENVGVDVALGAFPFEERSVQRASEWTWSEAQSLINCSAEDLIVHKAFAGRDQDWADIERVLIRQHGKLDWKVVRVELSPLLELKGEPEALDKLERMLAKVKRWLRTKS
ncbi:MAG: hypothetical protein FJ403_00960 [Verrucomicrobia bacterium]|nr:hypothetical protein [Verrucomicrobiota bacterium]